VQPGLKKDSHCTSRFHAVKINGSVVLDRDCTCSRSEQSCVIARRWIRMKKSGKAAGQRQQSATSQFGAVLMVSGGGRLSFHQKSHCIWTL
jgi:hypothetical protein